jgi:hypothetical protein
MQGSSKSGEITSSKRLSAGKSTQPVQIRYGIHRLEAHVAGKSVAEIRKLLQQPLNLDPQAMALINHRQASPQSLLQAGDQLEFVRLAGVKG